MRQLILLFYVFTFLNYINAQNSLSSTESFDELVASYSKFIYKDDSKALEYVIKAKELALVNGNTKQLTQAYYYISKCQYRLNKNTVALKNIESAITEGATVNDSFFLRKCFLLKGNILSELGEDSKALISYLKAKEYGKKTGNYIYEAGPITNIASIKKKHKDFQEAIDLYKNVLTDLSSLDSTADTTYYKLLAYMNIADAFLWMENPDAAEIYNKAGLNKCSDTIRTWAYYPLLMNKAIIFYQRAQYKACISLAKKVRDSSKGKEQNLYLTSLFYLGKSSYNIKNYKETIHYLEKMYDSIKSSADMDANEKELHKFLTLAYHQEKKPEKIMFHFQKYSALEKKQSIEDLKLNNETHKLIDVSPLKTEIDTLEEELTTQTRNKKGLVILALVFLFLFLSSIFYYRLREKSIKNKFDELLKKVSELENSQEKRTISRKDKVSDENVKAILDKIDSFEKAAYYLSTACSLNFMAEKLDTNATYLSKVINRYKGKSYSTYITELRINAALIRLKNEKGLQSYTIKAIAEEFGFKRQETFSRAFKTHTGIHPSQYLKNLKKNN
ncbi:helix-turn-helix domain-containing protein [uncultured Kordia sp.]|uniref:helix-turn-helix domain-containing protein n=1 Tax=uncultured Kordia sp. TaxID=507699 RepID=UPI0026376222|nr:helix-turn-helix domain-containing protein [uncultured Kordia sp.]